MPVSLGNRFSTLARFTLPAALAISALVLAGCNATTDSSSKSRSGASVKNQNGVTLASGDWTLDATTSASFLPGYMSAPLSFRLLSGWMNADRAKAAGDEADPDAQREQALASFGTLTLEIAAGKTEPGTYQFAPEVSGAETATVIIPADKAAGLDSQYTSRSGTLTIKSSQVEEGPYVTKVVAVDGSFDGIFTDEEGNTRPFTGTFRMAGK
jgi:hypothetical protein